MSTKCEGMRRYGGAFTLGVPQWVPCENDAIATLRILQGNGEPVDIPACEECWKEALTYPGMKIMEAKPI
jgi:hypothetical protein